ncbi:MAG: GNAT family N-acetyltransferase [Dehalococcoidia bacterium]|nr:GNAT family N-acetyltransferase [Dehalococcoidia bacterium]
MSAGEYRVVPYARERHGDGPWRVVARVFEEYGFPFAEADYDTDVLWPERHYREGWFLVAEAADGEVVGCVGISDEGSGEFELHRLYVLPEARGKGLGERLTREVIALARAAGARRLVLFSDVAFEQAHRLYERCGFRRNRFRYAPDPWQSREWGFVLEFEEER